MEPALGRVLVGEGEGVEEAIIEANEDEGVDGIMVSGVWGEGEEEADVIGCV